MATNSKKESNNATENTNDPTGQRKRKSMPPDNLGSNDGVPVQNKIRNDGTQNEVLLDNYRKRVRPCIDLIDKLRALGIDQDVPLPTIAVVGDQSAGKSSVLEAISGVQLPRGTGIVTRCPLELRLKHKGSGHPWRAFLYDQDTRKKIVIQNPALVGDNVREAQNRLTGSKDGVSEKLITLEVESDKVPDLTLIDLPGITRVALPNQPKNMPEQIKGLIRKYIQRQETIILAVVPANVDIATNEALQLAKEYDADGDRTLGIVTKPDLLDRGTEAGLISVLSNERYPLKKGYICVKCRGQLDLDKGQTLEEAFHEEEVFFKKEHFSIFHGEKLGTKYLAYKLTTELVEQIAKSLPILKSAVKQKLNGTNEILQKMGRGVPDTDSERFHCFVEVMQGFSDAILQMTSAGHPADDVTKYQIFNSFRSAFDEFSEKIKTCSAKINSKNSSILDELAAEIERARGPELPRFLNYQMFVKKVNEFIGKYYDPMLEALKSVSNETKDVYDKLISLHYNRFPELRRLIKGKVFSLIQEAYDTSEKQLQNYFEMEKLVYTQDAVFTERLDSTLRYKKPGESLSFGIPSESRGQAETMFDYILSYITIAQRRMSDMVPMVLFHELIKKLSVTIRTAMIAMVGDSNIIVMFDENKQVAQDRLLHREKYERLHSALAELEAFTY